MKKLFITEKPSVAREFANVFSEKMTNKTGYMEGDSIVITWCVGHLVTMSYPEKYDEKMKKWKLETLPFLPENFLYEVIPEATKQYKTVSSLMNREDISTIYVCTDSGREGEYIYRLIRQMSKVKNKEEKRVWIDSQTKDEIQRGIKEALPEKDYDNLSDAAYLRAKEDYLMGINFSRILSLKFGYHIAKFLNKKYYSIAVGRVMTCILSMVVRREREIRSFEKTVFYKVLCNVKDDKKDYSLLNIEWKVNEKSIYYNSFSLYKDNGFKQKDDAVNLISHLINKEEKDFIYKEGNIVSDIYGTIKKVSKKTEKNNPPLLYNLAELQNECSKLFKISPDETLKHVQTLYESKLVTYPRTDARVLSTSVAKEIDKNIKGLSNLNIVKEYTSYILEKNTYKKIIKSKYVNDKKITDHYAIIPTGEGFNRLKSLKPIEIKIYEVIVRRFLAIFLPPSSFYKVAITIEASNETFFVTGKFLKEIGYKKIMEYSFKKNLNTKDNKNTNIDKNGIDNNDKDKNREISIDKISSLRKGQKVKIDSFTIKEGETSPPKRYNSGSIILAMENAGQFVEDPSLREMIKSQGIGTSATRAGILNKLFDKNYMYLNKKTQIITPTIEGEIIYDIVNLSIKSLLNAEFTASWEKGLSMVENGELNKEEYMKKLTDFVEKKTNQLKNVRVNSNINNLFNNLKVYYNK